MVRIIGYLLGIGKVLMMLVEGGEEIYIGRIEKDLKDYEVIEK